MFISYAHVQPDQELAAKLSNFLETNGFDVFVDSKIRLGQNWVEQIDLQLRNSSHFVPLLSAASVKSDMVRREIAIAYKLMQANKITILPVRLGLQDELPYDISSYLDLIQYVVWHPGESFDPICRTILEAARGQETPSRFTQPQLDPHRFPAPELERVKSDLGRYLGPMARLVVDRAVKRAANWEELYELLASELPPGEERRKFQATRPR